MENPISLVLWIIYLVKSKKNIVPTFQNIQIFERNAKKNMEKRDY